MVSIIKALLFASLLVALTYGKECKNTHSRCMSHHANRADLKEACKSEWKVRNYCKKLCGFCDEEKKDDCENTQTDGYCEKYKNIHCRRSPYFRQSCKKTCGVCTGGKTTTTTTTKAPKTTTTERKTTKMPTTTKMMTTTTTKEPTATKKTTTTTKKPTTTEKKTTTTKSTKAPVIPSGGCGDKAFYCLVKEMFKPSEHCSKHGSVCIRTCGKCKGPENQKCANLTDRDPNCNKRNCRDTTLVDRNRAHVKCARTCCSRGELY